MKAQHEQIEVDRSQTLTEFIKEDQINLPPGELYDLIDIAVIDKFLVFLCLFSPHFFPVQTLLLLLIFLQCHLDILELLI
jgi:hypothetical protein